MFTLGSLPHRLCLLVRIANACIGSVTWGKENNRDKKRMFNMDIVFDILFETLSILKVKWLDST